MTHSITPFPALADLPAPDGLPLPDAGMPPATAELETILEAWHVATVRLQQTHELLRSEVARLSDELERKNRELARKNRLEDLGRMASHIAHEVRNNLVPVSLYLGLLRRRLAADAASCHILSEVEAGFTALDATVNDLLSFTASRQPQWEAFSLRELVDELARSLQPQCLAQQVATEIDVHPATFISADRDMLRRALLNLILNALDAMPDGGDLVVTSYRGGGCIEIEVADSGPGLADEDCHQVFEPFFSTKKGGTGLGLSVVHHTAEAHGGSVLADNCPEGGAAFTIRIPQPAMEAAA